MKIISNSFQPLGFDWFESLQFSPLLQTSCFVSMSVTTIRRPCFCPMPFLLHSHSMTSVKRTSSFHENSHSTRARSRVSRKQVIQNVSNLLEMMSHAAQKWVTRMTPVPHTSRHTNIKGRQVRYYYCDQCMIAVWIQLVLPSLETFLSE